MDLFRDTELGGFGSGERGSGAGTRPRPTSGGAPGRRPQTRLFTPRPSFRPAPSAKKSSTGPKPKEWPRPVGEPGLSGQTHMDTKSNAVPGPPGVPGPHAESAPTGFRRVWHGIQGRILGGLLVVLPILITVWVIYWLYSTLEKYVIDPL